MKIPIRALFTLLTLLAALLVAPATAQANSSGRHSDAVPWLAGSAAESLAAASNPCGGSAYACASGDFLVWNGDNGSRCEWTGNAPTLGTCTNKNYLVANYGYPCSGCDWIRLYWGSSYTGAYFCIPPGYSYGEPTSPNLTFNKGQGLSGYGQSIWYNSASAKWSGPC